MLEQMYTAAAAKAVAGEAALHFFAARASEHCGAPCWAGRSVSEGTAVDYLSLC